MLLKQVKTGLEPLSLCALLAQAKTAPAPFALIPLISVALNVAAHLQLLRDLPHGALPTDTKSRRSPARALSLPHPDILHLYTHAIVLAKAPVLVRMAAVLEFLTGATCGGSVAVRGCGFDGLRTVGIRYVAGH
jgi:hypothetical protein